MSEQIWRVPFEEAAKWSATEEKKRIRRAERVQLAGMAMMGLLASDETPSTMEGCARAARQHADNLLAELDRTETK